MSFFIISGPKKAVSEKAGLPLAFDSMAGLRSGWPLRTRLAMDEAAEADGPDRATKIRMVLALLKNEVSPEDLESITTMLNGAAGQAQDEPPAFPGKPIPGGGQVPLDVKAMDSKSAVRVIDAVISGRMAARRSFAEMFPHAAAIAKDAR